MRTYHLKVWPEYFEAIARGEKTFEARSTHNGARSFAAGDKLVLKEFKPDPTPGSHTGRVLPARVTYVLNGPAFGIEKGHVIMSIKVITDDPSNSWVGYSGKPQWVDIAK